MMMNTSVGGRRFPCGSKASARGGVRSTGTQRNNNNVFGERGLGSCGRQGGVELPPVQPTAKPGRGGPERGGELEQRREGTLDVRGCWRDIDAGAELVRRIQALSKGTGGILAEGCFDRRKQISGGGDGWSGDQAQARLRGRQARHDRSGPGGHVRERHHHIGRNPTVLPGLLRPASWTWTGPRRSSRGS